MATNYNKLWKLLTDKGMRKKDLQIATGISSGVITTTELTRICKLSTAHGIC